MMHFLSKRNHLVQVMAATSSSDELRGMGNALFQRGEFVAAIQAYTQAIQASPSDARAWCNRSLAYLKVKDPFLAWADASYVLKYLDSKNFKAYFRLAGAFQDLSLFDGAVGVYSFCLMWPLDDATRADVLARIGACTNQAPEPHQAMLSPYPDAHHTSEKDAKLIQDHFQTLAPSGLFRLAHVDRSAPGGPRDPTVLLSAFASTKNIELRMVDGKGFCLFAKKNFPAGTQIYLEQPLLAVPPPDQARCYHCCLPYTDVACSGGCDRRYCSSKCEGLAFEDYHSPLCGRPLVNLERLVLQGVSSSAKFCLLMWKMLGRAMVVAKETGKPLVAPIDLHPYCHFSRKTDGCLASQFELLTVPLMNIWEGISSACGVNDPALSAGWIRDAILTLAPNAIGVEDPDAESGPADKPTITRHGCALMGFGSFFNHSCLPNTLYLSSMNQGSTIRFKTLRFVRKNEELTIAYIPTHVPLSTRRFTLLGIYGFECKCLKCLDEEKREKRTRPR